MIWDLWCADDTGGDRGAEREERVEQVGDLQVHRGEVRGPAAGARVAAHGAPGQDEGVRRAHLPQEQLLPRRRARRAAKRGRGRPSRGPQRAAAAAQALLAAPRGRPPKSKDPISDAIPKSRGRPPKKAKTAPALLPPPATAPPPSSAAAASHQGTPRRPQRGGGGLTNPNL